MATPRCGTAGCQHTILPLWERLLVTAVAAGLALMVPISNAVGIDLNNSIASATYVVHWSVVVPVAVWIGALYFAWKEPAEHHMSLIINAAGIPGILMAILLAVSK